MPPRLPCTHSANAPTAALYAQCLVRKMPRHLLASYAKCLVTRLPCTLMQNCDAGGPCDCCATQDARRGPTPPATLGMLQRTLWFSSIDAIRPSSMLPCEGTHNGVPTCTQQAEHARLKSNEQCHTTDFLVLPNILGDNGCCSRAACHTVRQGLLLRAHLGDTLRHLHSKHDGVLLVEDAGGNDLRSKCGACCWRRWE